jgi:hypothetical protein
VELPRLKDVTLRLGIGQTVPALTSGWSTSRCRSSMLDEILPGGALCERVTRCRDLRVWERERDFQVLTGGASKPGDCSVVGDWSDEVDGEREMEESEDEERPGVPASESMSDSRVSVFERLTGRPTLKTDFWAGKGIGET